MPATYGTIALAAASLLLAACADSPPQPPDTGARATAAVAASAATRQVEEHVVDLSDSYFLFGCTADGAVAEDPTDGELVRMDGQMLVREVFMRDAAGNHHFTVHTTPIGMRGVGVASGEEFRVTERQIGGAIQRTAMLAGHYRTVQAFVGLDTGRRFSLVTAGHYTVGPDDVPVVTRDATTLSCRS